MLATVSRVMFATLEPVLGQYRCGFCTSTARSCACTIALCA